MCNICYRPIVNVLILLLYVLSASSMAANKVSVWVNPAVVAPNETLTLTVAVEGAMHDKPDFSVLEKDFQLLNRNNSSSVNMQRGSTQIKRNWEIVLLPRSIGRTTVPAIKVGNQYTTPLTIEVSNKPVIVHTRKERIFIEIEATPQQPYVHSQVLLAQRLYYAVPLDKAKLSEPVIKDNAAEIIPLSTRPTYEREIAGKRYNVIERTYALFPKKSGDLIIEPAEFHGLVPNEQSVRTFDAFNLFTRQQQAKHIRSKSLTIPVKARTASFSAKEWLPASNVTIYGKWSIAAGSEVAVGEPISMEMGIVSSGLRAASIPDLVFDVPKEVNVYAEKPSFDFTTAHSGLSGIRKQKITFMVTDKAVNGTVHLPKLRLAWWNTVTNQQEEAVLAGISFKVTGAQPLKSSQDTPHSDVEEYSANPVISRLATLSLPYSWWLVLSSLTLLSFILFAFYRHYRNRWKKTIVNVSIARPIQQSSQLYKQEDKREIEANNVNIMLAIQLACDDADPALAQQALQQWAADVVHINPATLSAIAMLNTGFAKEIAYLSRVLYARKEVLWQGQGLWSEVQNYQANHQASTTVMLGKNSVLQDLYPRVDR